MDNSEKITAIYPGKLEKWRKIGKRSIGERRE